MGKSTISMVIFNSYVKLPEGKSVVPLGLPKCPSSQQLVIPIIPGFTPPTALAFSDIFLGTIIKFIGQSRIGPSVEFA